MSLRNCDRQVARGRCTSSPAVPQLQGPTTIPFGRTTLPFAAHKLYRYWNSASLRPGAKAVPGVRCSGSHHLCTRHFDPTGGSARRFERLTPANPSPDPVLLARYFPVGLAVLHWQRAIDGPARRENDGTLTQRGFSNLQLLGLCALCVSPIDKPG